MYEIILMLRLYIPGKYVFLKFAEVIAAGTVSSHDIDIAIDTPDPSHPYLFAAFPNHLCEMPGSALISPSLEVILLYLGIPSFRCLGAGVFVAGGGHVDVSPMPLRLAACWSPVCSAIFLAQIWHESSRSLDHLRGGGGGHVVWARALLSASRACSANSSIALCWKSRVNQVSITIIGRQLPLRGLS